MSADAATDASAAACPATAETYAFQAEINQLMSLIINAFYSNKEIFLRELLSNASDAIDKARFKALQAGRAVDEDLRIRLIVDKDAKTLTLEDNGVGMTKDELIANLGTIARSGTKAFMEAAMEGKQDISLIGQFGVGFYSAYLVADRVTVVSKSEDADRAHEWSSVAGGTFTVTEADTEASRGTRIVLYLKEDQLEYLEETRLREVVKKHSAFLQYPIYLEVEREVEAEPADKEDVAPSETDKEDDKKAEADVKEADGEGTVEDAEEAEPEAPAEPAPKVMRKEWDLLNDQKPLWMLPADEVTPEQHAALYKSIAADWEDPLLTKQFHVEGQFEFRGVLYCPRRAPFDLFGARDTPRDNVKLYVRRVYIAASSGADKSAEILPEWLGFIRGVVDSDDLPLNVSREMLQQSRIMRVIRKNVVKRAVDMFTDLADDRERADAYDTFYDNFSKNIKLGIYEESDGAGDAKAVREKLVSLLRFHSTHGDGDARTSLADYVTRAKAVKAGQTKIYYITGESLKHVRNSPFLERLRADGYEVLFMVDPIDEYLMQRLREYKAPGDDAAPFTFVCITKDGALFDDDKADAEAYKPLCEAIKQVLEAEVDKVTLSTRIRHSPAVLVTGAYSWSANMERIQKAQALANTQSQQYMIGKKTMEINPDHAIVRALKERIGTAGGDAAAASKDLIRLLYDTALLSSGFQIEDASGFVARVHRMIALGLSLGDDEAADEERMPVDGADATETAMEEVD